MFSRAWEILRFRNLKQKTARVYDAWQRRNMVPNHADSTDRDFWERKGANRLWQEGRICPLDQPSVAVTPSSSACDEAEENYNCSSAGENVSGARHET
ncbi:MAG: hypothetical protein DLM73_03145 [Chthoniobacterales bacterium]|nr:MAG: hypothetical protein DLM73_03145 [Chthoniobacterales bacterium]